jgi:hypothetical protein
MTQYRGNILYTERKQCLVTYFQHAHVISLRKKAHVISREGYGAKLNRAGSHMTFFVQHET